MRILLNWLVSIIAIMISAFILPGVSVESFFVAAVVAVVLGLVNILIRPLFVVLTLPLTVFTFGLFLFVINALLIMLTDAIVPGFEVQSFVWALLFSLILSLVSWLFKAPARQIQTS